LRPALLEVRGRVRERGNSQGRREKDAAAAAALREREERKGAEKHIGGMLSGATEA
jgi:hypothetical protein